jgi:hypothetical protein
LLAPLEPNQHNQKSLHKDRWREIRSITKLGIRFYKHLSADCPEDKCLVLPSIERPSSQIELANAFPTDWK